MSKKLCIIQTGRLGDTIIALPIAKYYYDKGYLVDWYLHESFKGVFKHIDYVDNLIIVPSSVDIMQSIPYVYRKINTSLYEKIIDLSICFPGTSARADMNDETFVHTKYKIANVDISERWNLSYIRNIEKENLLYDLLVKSDEYILIHNDSSHGNSMIDINIDCEKIYVKKIENYEIFDWLKIIQNAKEIHCVDSSFVNFVDSVNELSAELFYYNTLKTPGKWFKTPLKNRWKIK